MVSRRRFLGLASSASLASAGLARAAAPAPGKPELFSAAARKAVASGLAYLKAAQHPGGAFGLAAWKGNLGVTGLCGLAVLSAGHAPGVGPFGGVLDQAIDFVLGKEDPKRPGYLHHPAAAPHGPMYGHGFAVWFLAQAYDQVKEKKRSAKLHALLGRAVALILKSQNAEHGWRYTPTSRDTDLTVTACQLCALRAARDAGFGVPRKALDGAAGYLRRCQNPGGSFRYMARGGGAPGPQSWARSAAAVHGLFCAGVTRGKMVEDGLKFLRANRPAVPGARPDMHYFYGHMHAALATCAAGGAARDACYPPTRDELLARQAANGGWVDLIDPHYGTAAALIALQAPAARLGPAF
jgi:hypothetical protein